MTIPHVPVLAGEAIELLHPRPGQTVVDCTFGAGGHARLLAGRIGAAGTLIAIDRDPVAAERFAELEPELAPTTRFIRASFVDGLARLRDEGVRVDIVLLDLGMSSMQVDTWQRGFSYSYDAPLDMRMDPDLDGCAHTLVNEAEPRHLETIFRDLGEERYARPIARAIVRARQRAPISSTIQLVDVISRAVPAPARFAAGHPAKRVFQALRIAVNDELTALSLALPAALDLTLLHGRVVVLAYHSLEDRMVKRAFASGARADVPDDFPVVPTSRQPQLRLLTRGAERAGEDEVAANPRARSVRLRAVERIREAA